MLDAGREQAMKPVITWVLLANTRSASILVNRGPGKGLASRSEMNWQSGSAPNPRDRAGVGHSIAGHGVAAVEQSDPQRKMDVQFAHDVSRHLSEAIAAKELDRLIVVAGPHMLGLLRASFDDTTKAALIGEIDKDLSEQPVEAVLSHIDRFIAA